MMRAEPVIYGDEGGNRRMKTELVTLGELIADFLPAGIGKNGYPLYELNPGGAPANVAAACAKLGLTAGMIGLLGEDPLGHMLRDRLAGRGVRCEGLCFTEEYPTAMSIVHLRADGERSFSFFGERPADMQLSADDLKQETIAGCAVFHFGARSLIGNTCRGAVMKAIRQARANGAAVSFDPNLRDGLWPDRESARRDALWGIEQADLVKLSREEMLLTYPGQTENDVLSGLTAKGKCCVITDGGGGVYAWDEGRMLRIPAYPVDQVDTTGAGDAFWGAFLFEYIREKGAPMARR